MATAKLIEAFLAAGKPVALVCHAPGVLRHVKTPAGKPLVEGKNVTGFTDGEEEAVGLTKVVPFLVEDELLGLGAIYSKVRTGASCRHRWVADHRPEPGLVRTHRQGPDRRPKDQIGGPTTVAADVGD